MKITFWGVRGSIASPGRHTIHYGGNTTCLEVTTDSGKRIIIDCGTGVRLLGDTFPKDQSPIEIYLLLTHIHWDHVMGFPFFAPLFHHSANIRLDGFKRGIEGLRRILSSSYIDGAWPIRFEDLKAKIEQTYLVDSGSLVIDDMRISAHSLQHPQGGLGFRFTENGRSFVFLTDNELTERGWTGSCFGDFVAFCRDADVLVHDCQYTPEEIELRRGWGHSDTFAVSRLAVEAEVKRLLLFHHDPWHTDQAVRAIEDHCRSLLLAADRNIPVEGAREGLTIELC